MPAVMREKHILMTFGAHYVRIGGLTAREPEVFRSLFMSKSKGTSDVKNVLMYHVVATKRAEVTDKGETPRRRELSVNLSRHSRQTSALVVWSRVQTVGYQ